ncbi:MAG: glycosyltransferase family 2 protein [Candidatus Hydrogenedentes bacterium]|nr:glycosyltransferase family 2 protein [Candidatus Hydrogenedentota bacterium]
MEKCDLSVVIISPDRGGLLAQSLSHLEQQSFPAARFEIVVVCYGPTANSRIQVQRFSEGSPVRTKWLWHHGENGVAARNLGLREASGRYVLFLDDDLVAAPALVREHVLEHQNGATPIAVAGVVKRHPQLPVHRLHRLFFSGERLREDRGAALGYLDWNIANLSLPRQLLLDSGGFDEALCYPHFDGADLGWRLKPENVQLIENPRASGYVWNPVTFASERNRHYARGYALNGLVERTRSVEVLRRYPVVRSSLRHGLDALAIRFYLQACERQEEDLRLFTSIYRRVFLFDLCSGYADRRRQRLPRLPVPEQTGQ